MERMDLEPILSVQGTTTIGTMINFDDGDLDGHGDCPTMALRASRPYMLRLWIEEVFLGIE